MTFLGRHLLAVAFIAFGLQQLLFGDFVPGRPPAWPSDLPGRLIWAYLAGACFIAAGAAITAGRKPRLAALVIATLVFAWAVVRNVAPALADHGFGSAWTRLGKAVALTGGALAVAGLGSAHRDDDFSWPDALLLAGRLALGSFLIASGIQHFLFTDFVKTLVPAWIPGARAWTYVAGVALIAGGTGLVMPKTQRIAGVAVGMMLLVWTCILHIPRALAAPPASQRNEWIAVFEAMAFAGIALVLTQKRVQNKACERSTDETGGLALSK